MIDISNIVMYICFVVAFLIWVKLSIKSAAKEELSQIRIDFTEALDKSTTELTSEIQRVDKHCTNTVNENAKNICAIVKLSIEEHFENKNNSK